MTRCGGKRQSAAKIRQYQVREEGLGEE